MSIDIESRANLTGQVGERLGGVWWSFMLRGIFAGILGLCALIWPAVSLNILLRLVGIYCIADGVAGLVATSRTADRGPEVIQAVISLVFGGVLLFWPGGSIRLLLVVFGAWALFSGVSQIFAARRSPADDPDRSLLAGVGGVACIVGLVLIFWPGTGVVTISWLIAAAALVIAAILIYLGLRLKRLSGRVETLRSERR